MVFFAVKILDKYKFIFQWQGHSQPQNVHLIIFMNSKKKEIQKEYRILLFQLAFFCQIQFFFCFVNEIYARWVLSTQWTRQNKKKRDKQLTKRKTERQQTNTHTNLANTLTLLSCSKWTEHWRSLSGSLHSHERRNGTDGDCANNNYVRCLNVWIGHVRRAAFTYEQRRRHTRIPHSCINAHISSSSFNFDLASVSSDSILTETIPTI